MLDEAPSEPVPGFPLKFRWQRGAWERIFDAQIELIRKDIRRARLDGKIVTYLSCPLSARGGGHSGTNVEIAKFTERRLLKEWGEQFWMLNPAQYQLESKEGAGLLDMHARDLEIDLRTLSKPGGGDYMRMWTKVLVEDVLPRSAVQGTASPLANTGINFEAFYFLGPSDVHAFFGVQRKGSLGAAIEEYFGRRHSFDREFRDSFGVASLDDYPPDPKSPFTTPEARNGEWQRKRRAFLLFYSLRASVSCSLGSHDEWVIFSLLNQARRRITEEHGGGIPNQIAGFFDGKAIATSAAERSPALGYAF